MLSMFAFFGIPAFAVGLRAIGTSPDLAVALHGIQVRVHPA